MTLISSFATEDNTLHNIQNGDLSGVMPETSVEGTQRVTKCQFGHSELLTPTDSATQERYVDLISELCITPK